MKKILLFLIVVPLFTTSCFNEVDGGYPNRVHFPKEGGEKSFTGEIPIAWFSIGSYNIEEYLPVSSKEQEDGSRIAVSDWLTVKTPYRCSTTIHLSVEPNPGNKKRKRPISMNRGGPEYMSIVIIQD